MLPTLQGKFLVASPHLGDGNFFRSVVLVIKHDADGAFGLILNRPLNNTLAEVWQAIDQEDITGSGHVPDLSLDAPLVGDQPIYVGGPVQGPLVVVHTLKKAYSE